MGTEEKKNFNNIYLGKIINIQKLILITHFINEKPQM